MNLKNMMLKKNPGELLLSGNEVSFWGDENILELYSNDGCTTF